MLTHCVRVPAALRVRSGIRVFRLSCRSPRPAAQSFVHYPNSTSPTASLAGPTANFSTSQDRPSSDTTKIIIGLKSKAEVDHFLSQLSSDQKGLLFNRLNLDVLRQKYHNELGNSDVHNYLTKFGRPSTHLGGHEDPTGTLTELSSQWLDQRLPTSESFGTEDVSPANGETKSLPPTGNEIWAVGLKNALPFVGFGFLDNLIMILAGDYIDITIGTALGISTMAAAALGNTISDVAGIASAWYVEKFAEKAGIREPVLTAIQMNSWQVRWATTSGRAIGVVIGCLLGMIPLIFLPTGAEKKDRENRTEQSITGSAKD